jgi:hypothetical protein
MKLLIPLFFFSLLAFSLKGQNKGVPEEGKVSFLSSQNVYVKFASTGDIRIGDTLFFNSGGQLIPVLVVDNKSSTSTVCSPIGSLIMKVNDVVIAKKQLKPKLPEPVQDETPDLSDAGAEAPPENPSEPTEESPAEAPARFREKQYGRISVASYNSLSSYRNTNRMRYALIYRADHLKNSRFSVNSYITFRHTLGEWNEVKGNIGSALKVFNLSVSYAIDEKSSLTIGRGINPQFSSLGAIDGIQFEKGLGNFRIGAIAGSRPNFTDYSPDFNLLQFGVFAGFVSPNPSRFHQTTLGFSQQLNGSQTDRRFVFIQHSGEWVKNLYVFGSMEMDLYENINNQVNNSPRLTNLFLSLRYRVSPKLRLSASYDTRKNIIYYESYKNFIDQFIDDETRQGLRVGLTHRPWKNINWSINANLRFQQSQRNPSQNINALVSIGNIPFIHAGGTIRATLLRTDYLTSQIYGARLSREIIPGRLSGEVYYNWVNYRYNTSERIIKQNIAGLDLSLKVMKRLSLNVFYESVFDAPPTTYHRINAQLIKRF